MIIKMLGRSVFLLMITLTIAACSVSSVDTTVVNETDASVQSSNESPTESGDPEVEQQVPVAVTEPSQTPTEIPAATATEVSPTATETAVQAQVPTPRADLSATSPGDVNLTSGGVQLVEFFAHW